MMTTPVRLQLSRRKGFNLQALSLATNGLSARRVSRPGPFGNPWKVADEARWGNGWVVLDPNWVQEPKRHYCSSRAVAQRYAKGRYREWLQTGFGPSLETIRGLNLACFCKLGDPCHADVLLELANTSARP